MASVHSTWFIPEDDCEVSEYYLRTKEAASTNDLWQSTWVFDTRRQEACVWNRVSEGEEVCGVKEMADSAEPGRPLVLL